MFIHHPTPHDPMFFGFNMHGNLACHPLHFQASFIALMLEAQPLLASVTRISGPKTDIAAREVIELMRLYNRMPQGRLRQPTVSVQTETGPFLRSLVQKSAEYSTTRVLPTVPGSPSLLAANQFQTTYSPSIHQVPGLTPSSSTSTNADSDASGFDCAYTEADSQLLGYAKEPAMSWEDLKNRLPLVAGEQVGSYRFATAEEICRRWQQ